MENIEHIHILESKVSLIDYAIALTTFENWVTGKSHRYVCVANVHTVMLGTENPAFRKITNGADMVAPDGQPLRFVANMKGAKLKDRVYGPTLMEKTCERFQEGYSHFFYEGVPGVPEKLKDTFRFRFPKINVVGTYSPPFRRLTDSEDNNIIELINRANPDFLWVGLGAPKQEFWMAEHAGKVNAGIMLGVGAAFDFHTGRSDWGWATITAHNYEVLLVKTTCITAYNGVFNVKNANIEFFNYCKSKKTFRVRIKYEYCA